MDMTLGMINLWKYSFQNNPEYIKYNKIRQISGEILDKFVDFIDPIFNDYIDVIRIELFDIIKKYNINFDVEFKEIDSQHTLKTMLYCYDNGGKISQKYYEASKIRKPEKIEMMKSIINSNTSFFEVVKEGSSSFKTIVRDIITNKRYEIIDTGISFANLFMKDNIKTKYILSTLICYDGIYFFDNSLILNKKMDEVQFLLNIYKKYNIKPLHTWFLASTINDNTEEL